MRKKRAAPRPGAAVAMERYALPLFRAGHIPIVGEWLALPLVALAGSRQIGDEPFTEIFHPIAERVVARCDAILRVGGASQGADLMVQQARALGLAIYERLGDVHSLLRGRSQLAGILMERATEGDREEAHRLLRLALDAARRLKLPEAQQIEAIIERAGRGDD